MLNGVCAIMAIQKVCRYHRAQSVILHSDVYQGCREAVALISLHAFCSVGSGLHRPLTVPSVSLWPSSGEVPVFTSLVKLLLVVMLPQARLLACSDAESGLCCAAFIFHEDIKSLPMAIVGMSLPPTTSLSLGYFSLGLSHAAEEHALQGCTADLP